jgi:SAM-dependent methyltransferase
MVEELRTHAERLKATVESPLALRFLEAVRGLPRIKPRVIYRDRQHRRAYSAEAYARLDEAARRGLSRLVADEQYYYATDYGTPLAYVRALDLLGQAGVSPAAETRLFDFGYGGVGHLRLLASLGFQVVGVDVSPILTLLYGGAGDQGRVPAVSGAVDGQLKLVEGQWPSGPGMAEAVGGGFDVIVSKNVLKKGYIHPDRPTGSFRLVELGADDATFLKAVFDALKPGGRFLIYNICPALSPPDKPFIPWSDGRSPFSRAQLEAAGFRVRELDRDDVEAVRRLGRLVEWDRGEGKMDLEHDLSVLYTLVEKPR